MIEDSWPAVTVERMTRLGADLSPVRSVVAFYAPIWARNPVEIHVNATPDAVVEYLVEIARNRTVVRTRVGLDRLRARLATQELGMRIIMLRNTRKDEESLLRLIALASECDSHDRAR